MPTPPVDDYGVDDLANQLMVSLLADEDLSVVLAPLPEYTFPFDPTSSIFKQVVHLTNADLTTETIGGKGTFDVLMSTFKVHLREEYDNGRITGAEYTKAYIELTAAAMGNAVQFLLGRDQAFWAAANAQIASALALTQLSTEKLKYAIAQIELKMGRANFALTKIKLATEGYTFGVLLPKQAELLAKQVAFQQVQTDTALFNLDTMLPKQLVLLAEQVETQRAQTMETRTDGTTPITGQVGKQKELYSQQITSYKRDAEAKVAKIFTDAWITQKTIDEGLLAPDQFTNAEFNELLSILKVNAELGTGTP